MKENDLCCVVNPDVKCPSCNLFFCKPCNETFANEAKRRGEGQFNIYQVGTWKCPKCGAESRPRWVTRLVPYLLLLLML